ncbi:MAG TPA: Calx-beta domain-containing protein [Pyrinomonadaceae bacterium]
MPRPRLLRPYAARLLLFTFVLTLAVWSALPPGYAAKALPTAPAASNYVVTTTGDAPDSNTADGVCNDGAGNCTLRAAIEQANVDDTSDMITFAPGVTGVISLLTPLPDLTSMTITGPGPSQLTVRREDAAPSTFRVITLLPFRSLNISGITISGGYSGRGGGIRVEGSPVSLTNVVVSGNTADGGISFGSEGRGAGIYQSAGVLNLINSTVSGNVTKNAANNSGHHGAGIYTTSNLNVTGSTIAGNRIENGGGAGGVGLGGGIYVASGSVALTNSTVSGNSAGATGGQGGGIFKQGGTVMAKSCTVTENTADSAGGGIANSAGTFTLQNCIVANNAANSAPDLFGAFSSQGYNLVRDVTGATITGATAHNITNLDPLLGPLQNNKGPTQTHALLSGSPAVDAGDSGGLTTDQRGLLRPIDLSAVNVSDGADIGAYEVQAGQIQFGSATYSVAEGAGFATLSVTRTGGDSVATSATFATSDGSATAGADYVGATGTITFAADEVAKDITVPITDDSLIESDETFTVTLSAPTGGATLGTRSAAAVIIVSDDVGPALPFVQFSASEASVGEAAGALNVSVQRTGDLSGTSSVSYATSNGTANDRSDYTAAYGMLIFTPGQESKTITVFVTDDRYQEPNETFTITLSGASGAALGLNQSVTATIASDDSASGLSPVKGGPSFDPEFFVRQHYLDFLNRAPDAAGLAFWSNQTTNCGDADLLVCRINVSAAFFLSGEFQETGFYTIRAQRVAYGKKSTEEATRVTFAQFIRDARQVGEGFVDGQPGAGAVLENNKNAYALQVAGEAAFAQRFPQTTADAYVDALFASAGVTATAQERQNAVNAYGGGGAAGRAATLRSVADSASVRNAEFRSAFVLMEYFGYMRRDPDQAGYTFWLGKLNEFGGNYIAAEMVKAFITSGEYINRFGQ